MSPLCYRIGGKGEVDLDFTEHDSTRILRHLPTSEHSIIPNQINNIFYELGVPRCYPERNERIVFEAQLLDSFYIY
jgi:hypothetical protein